MGTLNIKADSLAPSPDTFHERACFNMILTRFLQIFFSVLAPYYPRENNEHYFDNFVD